MSTMRRIQTARAGLAGTVLAAIITASLSLAGTASAAQSSTTFCPTPFGPKSYTEGQTCTYGYELPVDSSWASNYYGNSGYTLCAAAVNYDGSFLPGDTYVCSTSGNAEHIYNGTHYLSAHIKNGNDATQTMFGIVYYG